MSEEDSALKRGAKNLVAGTVGGVAQTIVGHPFDTIKVKLQTQTGQYSGMVDCAKKTIAKEGPAGLMRGVASPLVGQGFMNACQFVSYGQAKAILGAPNGETLQPHQYVIAGAMTGFAISFVDSPVDLFKCKMQTSSTYKSTFDCAKHIAWQYGVRGVYQGLGATMLRDVPANAVYFGSYEAARRYFAREGQAVTDLPPLKLLASGGIGGICYWLATYPFDVIKSAMQTDSSRVSERKYQSLRDCASQLLKDGGIRRFYVGFLPCILRSAPANAACFFAYERSIALVESL